MDRAVIAVTSDADRVLAAALGDLGPVLTELRGSVLVVGGLMQRIWLELRPVEGIAPRATADVDLGIDRKSLQLTASSERVGPLLTERDYTPLAGEDGFRFEKALEHGSMIVDLFVAKGASRDEPPILEKGIATLAAPGLAYALTRPTVMVELELVEGRGSTVVEVPLPSLDAAFVLKAALVASGVRLRPDRRERDTVDAVMLAAVCASDSAAVHALAEGSGRSEVKRALSLPTRRARPRRPRGGAPGRRLLAARARRRTRDRGRVGRAGRGKAREQGRRGPSAVTARRAVSYTGIGGDLLDPRRCPSSCEAILGR